MKKCAVVIPIYKEELSNDEKASLQQCQKILNKFDIKLICPKNLNICEYEKLGEFQKMELCNDYFASTHSYSRMLLDKDFYKNFIDYEYILIYQLDAWVFEDKLDYWCDKKLDYIGAPWFDGFGAANSKSKMLKYAGNGGFSLRKVQRFIDVLSKSETSEKPMRTFKEMYTKEGDYSIFHIFRLPKGFRLYFSDANKLKNAIRNTNECEDNIIVNNLRRTYNDFKVAKSKDAKFFAFETQPSRLFKECGGRLPFGCHAFKKYDWDFWKKYINID